MDGAVNVHLDATEYNDSIIFMHSVQDGAASKSYGIQVAKLAGIPSPVLELARAELAMLETGAKSAVNLGDNTITDSVPSQSELLLAPINSALQKRLDTMLPDELSPKQALDLIYELKKLR